MTMPSDAESQRSTGIQQLTNKARRSAARTASSESAEPAVPYGVV